MHLNGLQIVALIVIGVMTVVGVALFARAIGKIYSVVRLGQPDPTRGGEAGKRTHSLLLESLGHARLGKWPLVGIMHWFVFVGFLGLVLTLLNAYGQLVDPTFVLPLIGHWPVYEWITELLAWGTTIGIAVLIAIRQKNKPNPADGRDGRRSRFYGSTFWQAYYVEATIAIVGICILTLRGLESALLTAEGETDKTGFAHFPLTGWIGNLFSGASVETLKNWIVVIAAIKIIVSMGWFITVGLQPSMGVAWHRFLAFFTIWFKRHPGKPDGQLRPSLGELQPIRIKGEVLDFEKIDELDDEPALGVGKVEDFTWKGLLDFTSCTECGRCQSQCPAWNTEKPLSPKLVMLELRNHAHGKAPWLLAAEDQRDALDDVTKAQAERPLVGPIDLENPLAGGVIDPDVLWSCTTCGACVQQCPVDIEHVDAIVDMRRYQVLIESAFPSELNGLFKNLEKNANPWGSSPRQRLEWAKGLPFEVKQVGADIEDLSEVDYLFWVGCAGAYEDRQKKTTRAVAELLNTAGVSFAVLGDGESCTGDSARRAGNEFLFTTLAMTNIEVLNESKATKIVVTCAHCFNTLKNEYPQLGGNYEVVHHTQLLNRLVRDGKLTPVAPLSKGTSVIASASGEIAQSNGAGSVVTYHDPCYIGRHNGIYTPPRELISALPGVTLTEMPRHGERSFCCGAGGARMWMEEKLGSRINVNRVTEAVETGADKIGVGCPFCRVMLSDGLTAAQAGEAGASEELEVVDVAQMLLAAVRRSEPVGETAEA